MILLVKLIRKWARISDCIFMSFREVLDRTLSISQHSHYLTYGISAEVQKTSNEW